jgi:hypothetical protein
MELAQKYDYSKNNKLCFWYRFVVSIFISFI